MRQAGQSKKMAGTRLSFEEHKFFPFLKCVLLFFGTLYIYIYIHTHTHTHTHTHKKSVINMGTKVYNKLSGYIKEIDSYKVFKKELKLFLLLHIFYSVEKFVSL